MSWGATVVLILFGAFVILLIVNPSLSCFGKRLRSPFYPLFRKKQMKKRTTDYHLDLDGGAGKKDIPQKTDKPAPKIENYGFRLD